MGATVQQSAQRITPRSGAVAPTIATSTLQLVAIVITGVAAFFDNFSRSACETCDPVRLGNAGLIYVVPTFALALLTVAAIIYSAVTRRSSTLVPIVGAVGTVVAYFVARAVFYG
jgi:hypothetical protein